MNNLKLTAQERDYWVTLLCLGGKEGLSVNQTAKKLGVDPNLLFTWERKERREIIMIAAAYYSYYKAVNGDYVYTKICVEHYAGTGLPVPCRKSEVLRIFNSRRGHIERRLKFIEDSVRAGK